MSDDTDSRAPQRPRQYWAFCANPDNYRIEDAVRELEIDSWNVPKGDVRAGDRAIIWKALGRNGVHRGIIAFVDVLTNPAISLDPNKAYWVGADHRSEEPVQRVSIRYVRPAALPLWLDGPHHDLLSALTVSRGQGTVFHVTAPQWNALMAAIGGWPHESPDIADVTRALDEVSGKGQVGQGFLVDARKRRAIELHAMAMVTEHYAKAGWQVQDVSKNQSYDLHCTRSGVELRVEVKGTTGDGSQVLLTRNEVEHARQHHPLTSLCVVANICVRPDSNGVPQVSGGDIRILQPWDADAGMLTPLAYAYTLP